MKKRMLFIIAIAILSSLGVVTCKSLGDRVEDTEKNALLEQAEQVGVVHNQLLDTVINAILEERAQEFLQSGGKTLLTRTGGDALDHYRSIILNVLEKRVESRGESLDNKLMEKFLSEDVLTRAEAEGEMELTPFQKGYYDRLMRLLSVKGISLEEVQEGISIIEKEIVEKAPSEEEALVVLCITSTARYSVNYWYENLAKWNMMINGEIIAVWDRNNPDAVAVFNDDVITRSTSETRSPDGNPCDEALRDLVGKPLMYTGVYPEGTIYYALLQCPNYFYVFSEGALTLMKCPDLLVWDQLTCTCDWPYQNTGGNANEVSSGGFWGSVGDFLKVCLNITVHDVIGGGIGAVLGAGSGNVGMIIKASEYGFAASAYKSTSDLYESIF